MKRKLMAGFWIIMSVMAITQVLFIPQLGNNPSI